MYIYIYTHTHIYTFSYNTRYVYIHMILQGGARIVDTRYHKRRRTRKQKAAVHTVYCSSAHGVLQCVRYEAVYNRRRICVVHGVLQRTWYGACE